MQDGGTGKMDPRGRAMRPASLPIPRCVQRRRQRTLREPSLAAAGGAQHRVAAGAHHHRLRVAEHRRAATMQDEKGRCVRYTSMPRAWLQTVQSFRIRHPTPPPQHTHMLKQPWHLTSCALWQVADEGCQCTATLGCREAPVCVRCISAGPSLWETPLGPSPAAITLLDASKTPIQLSTAAVRV